MLKILEVQIVYPVQSDAWCSDVVSFNPAYRWCVHGVVYMFTTPYRYIYICMCVCVYIYIYIYIYVCVYMCVYI